MSAHNYQKMNSNLHFIAYFSFLSKIYLLYMPAPKKFDYKTIHATIHYLQGCVWGRARPKDPKSHFFFPQNQSKYFLLFTSHQSLFIIIQIKKLLQNKFFHFFIQNIFFSSHQPNLLQYRPTSFFKPFPKHNLNCQIKGTYNAIELNMCYKHFW